ncbi:STAS domain-containing protein [Paractinoplanes hotanensis]|nr:STAS domain-containing protein [Actinoplanes hotanensis]
MSSDGFHQDSGNGLTVTIHSWPGDGRAHVRLAGEIDIDVSVVLSRTVDWLATSAPVSVLVDLAELTFACATLPNFLVHVRHVLPDGAELILWRPRPLTEWVLQITGMAAIAVIRDTATESLSMHGHLAS